MKVINIHVTIARKIVDTTPMDEEEGERCQRNDIGINGHVEQVAGTGVDREMRELQEAIRLLRNSAHQPLRIYTVNNAVEKYGNSSIFFDNNHYCFIIIR